MVTTTPRSPRTYLSQNDAIMWTVESDPLLRSTIVGVVVLDGVPEWRRVVARMEHVVKMVPELREKVVPVPLHPTTWRWEPDPEFDLQYHLRRAAVPSPGTLREVLDLAHAQASGGFDRTRPLWEFTLYEGLADSKYRPCPLLVKYVEAGWLGRKAGRGFYDYGGEQPVPTR